MVITAGTRLGAYEIISQLGAGGMGEVYRARDTRLDRDVAVKVLPVSFATDADRLSRFEQEARATSSLNHPNVLTVHDFGTHEGSPYIVAELLVGEELRQQLNNGALPQRKAVDYAQQICAGLAAAHERGITHRDLKPENLFVATDGRLKILDFGLAKLRPQAGQPVGSGVATQRAITDPGVVMGTVGYMSPEQVRGEEADHRADIFSFGVILFEMLTGRRAFQRETMAETMTAILKEEPEEVTEINSKVPLQLERIVRRCLEKKPERRFQTASDLGFAIEALSAPSSSSGQGLAEAALDAGAAAKRGGWRGHIAWVVAGVLGLALLAVSLAYFNRSAAEPRAVRLSFIPPENLLGFENGLYDYVIVSPDGQKLAFTGRSADGRKQLWVRPLNSTEAQPLPGTDDPQRPFWSPDSRSICFASRGKLMRFDLAGSRPQTLCDAPDLRGGTWSRAGVILFKPRPGGHLFQIPASGGEPIPVTSPDSERGYDRNDPRFLPDGRHFLYSLGSGERAQGVLIGSLDSQDVKQVLTDDTSADYAPPGWLLFVRNGALVAQAFDIDRLELKGEAFLITQPIPNAYVLGNRFSVSENGVLIWQGDLWRDYQLVWFDREGRQVGTVGTTTKSSVGQTPRLSSDGKRIVITRLDPQTRNSDIWVIDLARNLATRLTSDPAFDQQPLWSPDDSRVAFQTGRGDVGGIYQKAASGVGTEELLLKEGFHPTDWSADGRFIFHNPRDEKTRRDIWVLRLTGDLQPHPLLNSAFDEYRAQLSRDGRWLAYVSDESGSYEVYAQPFTTEGKLGGNRVLISTSGGNQPRWRRDGQELFYVATDGQMMAVAVKTNGTRFEPDKPKALFKTRIFTGVMQSGISYDVTSDGQRFLIGTIVGEATPVSVILNWTAEVKK